MPLALHGVLAPVVSTFGRDGALARAPFERNVRAYLAAGLQGVLVAGSSGEAALLDEAERLALVEWARAVIPRDRTLLVGIGAETARQTIARAHDARAAGADAVLVVAPHYYARMMDARALEAHYRAVADASPLPVLLYNVPAYAHLVLPAELVHAMAAHENVVGMKDSAGDLAMLDRYLEVRSPAFRVLSGSGGTVQTALERGASGAILAVGLFAPGEAVALADAVARGDAERASVAQARLAPLARDVAAAFGPPGIKAAMDLVGLSGGPPRAPLLPLPVEQRAEVAALLARTGLLAPADDAGAVPAGAVA